MSPSKRASAVWNPSFPMERAIVPMRAYHSGADARRSGPRETPVLLRVRSIDPRLPAVGNPRLSLLSSQGSARTAARLAAAERGRYSSGRGKTGRTRSQGRVQPTKMLFSRVPLLVVQAALVLAWSSAYLGAIL